MVAAAERRAAELGLANVDFLAQDAQALELPDASVDGVLCRWGYMLVPEPSVALSETARVLRPGGRLAFAVWASADENPWGSAVGRALVARGLTGRPEPDAPGPVQARRRGASTRASCEDAGLEQLAQEDVPLTWRYRSFDEFWETTLDLSSTLASAIAALDEDDADDLREDVRRARSSPTSTAASSSFPALSRVVARVAATSAQMIVSPSALATSSTASRAVVFSRSRIGFTSTTSSEPRDARLGDELHREVRLAIGQAAAHRRSHTRCDIRVEDVHVERDVDEPGARDPVERLPYRALDPDAVDLAHREDAHSCLSEQPALAVVEQAGADERDPLRVDRRQRPGVTLEPRAGEAESRGERHPVDVPAGARLGRVDVRVGVDPEHSARSRARRPCPPSVPSATEWSPPSTSGSAPRLVASATRAAMSSHVSWISGRKRARSSRKRGRLGNGGLDVPSSRTDVAETDEPLLETRVADRGRPHVDTAATLAQVERRADDGDLRSRVPSGEPNYTESPRRGSSAGRAHG